VIESRAMMKRRRANERANTISRPSLYSLYSLSLARSSTHISGWLIGLPGACVCVLTGAGWALDADVIDMADECGTLLEVEGMLVTMLDVLIERGGGGAAPASVPPMPGTRAKSPVNPLGPPASLGRQRRLKSEAEESSEDIVLFKK